MKEDYQGFGALISQFKNDIAGCKKQLGIQGKIPPIMMALDFNNNHGYTQKQTVEIAPANPLGEKADNYELAARYMAAIEAPSDTIEAEFHVVEDKKDGE